MGCGVKSMNPIWRRTMLNSLSITNFRKHASLDVSFTEGVNVICGANYQGKSTLLHAIMFALFGVSAVPGGAAAAWKKGTDRSKVTLSLTLAGKQIIVGRTRTGATLSEGGEEIATGTSAVNDRMTVLLGLSRADFSRIKYARQGETSALLTYGAAPLNEMIERVSGADLVSSLLSSVRDIRLRQEGVLSYLEWLDVEACAKEVSDTKTRLEQALLTVEQEEEAEKNMSASLTNLTCRLGELEEHNREVVRRADTKTKLQAEIEALGLEDSQVKKAHDALGPAVSAKALEDLEKEEEAVRQLLARIEKLDSDKASGERFLESAISALSEEENRLEGLKECRRHAESAMRSADAGGEVSDADIETVKDRVRVVSDDITLLRAAINGADCPTCGKPMEEGFDKVTAGGNLADLLKELESLNTTREDLRRRKAQNDRLVESLRDATRDLEQFPYEAVEEYKTEILVLKAQIKEHAEALALCKDPAGLKTDLSSAIATRKEAASKQAESAKLQGRLESIDKSLAALNEKLADLPEALEHKEVHSLEKEIKAGAERIQAVKERLSCAVNARGECKYSLTAAEAALKTAEDTNAALDKAEQRKTAATQLQAYLKSNRETFMDRTWANLLAYASSMCSDVTGGAIQQLQRNSDSFTYLEDENEMPIASASGAQSSLMGLALKMALAGRLQDNFQCLLLDEVSADMDEPHSQAVMAFLRSTGQQIIAVSHRDMDLSGDCNVISL